MENHTPTIIRVHGTNRQESSLLVVFLRIPSGKECDTRNTHYGPRAWLLRASMSSSVGDLGWIRSLADYSHKMLRTVRHTHVCGRSDETKKVVVNNSRGGIGLTLEASRKNEAIDKRWSQGWLVSVGGSVTAVSQLTIRKEAQKGTHRISSSIFAVVSYTAIHTVSTVQQKMSNLTLAAYR